MRLLIGGSPCTHWSIAQCPEKRETKAQGLGWELFCNYLVALEKYKPDYFLYENNKSMSAAIREQIATEFGFAPVLINSALVSAQNRQRLYWVGKREADGTCSKVEVCQPADKGILLKDVLEVGAVPAGICAGDKARTMKAQYGKNSAQNFADNENFQASGVAEPISCYELAHVSSHRADHATVRIGDIGTEAQAHRVYSCGGKSVNLTANGGGQGAKTGLYAVPVCVASRGWYADSGNRFVKTDAPTSQYLEARTDGKTNAITTVQKDNMVAEPAVFNNPHGYNAGGIVYEKAPTVTAGGRYESNHYVLVAWDGKTYPVHRAMAGQIAIKGKTYPIKLADGFYIIRKLTVTECKRLQTVPDWYKFPVSDTQAYKMLGNGWTVDVIRHIMGHFEGITREPVAVLSMYDGMSCGRIVLDAMGVDVQAYYATEIDKYAVQTTMHNYPDVVQLGDAFAVREDGWVSKLDT